MEWCRAVTVSGKYRASKDCAGWMRVRLLCLLTEEYLLTEIAIPQKCEICIFFLHVHVANKAIVRTWNVEKIAFIANRWAAVCWQKKADLLPEKQCQSILRKGLCMMITKNCLFLTVWLYSAKPWEVFISSRAFITTSFSRLQWMGKRSSHSQQSEGVCLSFWKGRQHWREKKAPVLLLFFFSYDVYIFRLPVLTVTHRSDPVSYCAPRNLGRRTEIGYS